MQALLGKMNKESRLLNLRSHGLQGVKKSPFVSRPTKTSINKGTQGVHARYDAILLPFISIVSAPGRPARSITKTKPDKSQKSPNGIILDSSFALSDFLAKGSQRLFSDFLGIFGPRGRKALPLRRAFSTKEQGNGPKKAQKQEILDHTILSKMKIPFDTTLLRN